MTPPAIVFGAGGIGNTEESFTYTWTTPETVSALLTTLQSLEIVELDGAASYPPGNPWDEETLLGKAKAAEKGFKIDSKVAVHEGLILNEESIPKSINRSLELLGATKVRTLYAHVPDVNTPIEVTAGVFDRVWKEGKFERLGLCNHSAEQLEEYFAVCDAKGYVKPAVFQGHYNPLVRNHEAKIIPLLRKHKCAYYAYSPLAGGFLTGKVTFREDDAPPPESAGEDNPQSSLHRTRWEGKSSFPQYMHMFHQPYVHDALRKFKAVLDEVNAKSGAEPISLTEATLRLVMHHSELDGALGDGVILGAKREDQLKGNVEMCRKGPLPEALVKAADEMWEDVKVVMDDRWAN